MADLDTMLESIEASFFMSETTFPHMREVLMGLGNLKAWYRLYRGKNQWSGKVFMEEHVFLTDQVLVWVRTTELGRMGIHLFRLEHISQIDRTYDFVSRGSKELELKEVLISFTTMKDKKRKDTLCMKRPLPEEGGDLEGYLKLVNLLA